MEIANDQRVGAPLESLLFAGNKSVTVFARINHGITRRGIDFRPHLRDGNKKQVRSNCRRGGKQYLHRCGRSQPNSKLRVFDKTRLSDRPPGCVCGPSRGYLALVFQVFSNLSEVKVLRAKARNRIVQAI